MSAMTLLTLLALASPSAGPRRMAVIVGANKAPPGRQPLRFAYTDAGRMRDALVTVGKFAASDVTVLADPTPETVLKALDQKTAALRMFPNEETMLLFYYSGHADMQAIYPRGQRLAMDAIKTRIEESRATVRIGMLDACRGGAWTGAKSLTPESPFELSAALGLNNEGSVFIASSSGMEDAHESEALAGSFFTHHFVAGMLGAADTSNDGEITLGEAYRYAQALTVRDSAIAASQPQHPSFEMNLKGKSDLTIAEVHDAPSSIEVAQDTGPLEVVHLGTGIIVLELSKGPRSVRAALPPGRYLVRLRTPFGTRARAIELTAGVAAFVREEELLLVGANALATKGPDEEPSSEPALERPRRTPSASVSPNVRADRPFVSMGATPPPGPKVPRRGWVDFNVAIGAGDGTTMFAPIQPGVHFISNQIGFSLGIAPLLHITERLRWAMATLAFDYRFGTFGRYEITPSIGIWNWGFGVPTQDRQDQFAQIFINVGASLDAKVWLKDGIALQLGGRMQSTPTVIPIGPYMGSLPQRYRGLDTWTFGVSASMWLQAGSRVRLSVGLGYAATPVIDGKPAAPAEHTLTVGSVGYDGLTPTPLFAIQTVDFLQVVGYGGFAIQPVAKRASGWGTVGVAFAF